MLENCVSLCVVTSDDVTQSPETWSHHLQFSTIKEADKVGNNTSINHTLDLLIWTIGEVGQGPAGIRQDLLVRVLNELSQDRKTLLHNFKWWRRILVTTQVGDCPGDDPEEGRGGLLVHQSQQGLNDAIVDDGNS